MQDYDEVVREYWARRERQALLLTLLDILRADGSWCGDPRLERVTFLLQELLEVQLPYQYFLDSTAPSSTAFGEELSGLHADRLIELEPRPGFIDPDLVPTALAPRIVAKQQHIVDRHVERMRFLAAKLNGKSLLHLGTLTTALFVSRRRCPPDASVEDRARRIHEIRPHINLGEATGAVRAIDALAEECRTYLRENASSPTAVA
jgi:hypothetical protein